MRDSKFCVYKLMLSLNVIHWPHASNISVLFSLLAFWLVINRKKKKNNRKYNYNYFF